MQEEQEQVPEEWLDAQRATVEAIDVGRLTLEEAIRQGEQLKHAEKMADDTKYAIDKSSRLLRGMTWSGWAQNIFSKDVTKGPSLQDRTGTTKSTIEYKEVPPFAQSAAQTIQNFQANLLVLKQCETNEQRQTSKLVCDNMFRVASQEIERLRVEDNPRVVQELSTDLQRLRRQQNEILQIHNSQMQLQNSLPTGSNNSQQSSSPTKTNSTKEEEHLNFLSGNLSELNTMALSLNETFSTQSKIIDSIEETTESNYEKTKMVSRRADRLTQKKNWTPPKKVFDRWVTIKHIETGRYIADLNGSLALVDELNAKTCIFGVWTRHSSGSSLFGLKSKSSGRFAGQTMMGSLSCTSTSFGQREEWQVDGSNWEQTRLLCASANWGAGGYLTTVTTRQALKFAKIEEKASCDLWCLGEG